VERVYCYEAQKWCVLGIALAVHLVMHYIHFNNNETLKMRILGIYEE
jgi:hypothetical protein